jgi:DNA processing protein
VSAGVRVPAWLDVEDERTARAAWSRLTEPGDRTAARVVAMLGPGRALLALVQSPRDVAAAAGAGRGDASPAARWRVRLADLDPRRDLWTVSRFGGRLVIPADAEWPSRLDHLGDRSPFALWVRGPIDLAAACERSAALVGSRACSGYGEHVAAELATGCADRRVTVVSGAAYGIDGCAHRAVLAVDGTTVAVLACGVDRPYPRGHADLLERIALTGAVVSEIPPGSSPTRWRFVQRNRLIAAMTTATVVVEAGWRSGALITAHEAVELGRPVAAVPGPVTSVMSAGCHRLLREGASCVTDAPEVVELVGAIGEQLALLPPVQPAVHDGLDPVDLRVLDALPLRRPAGSQSVARTAGLDHPTVCAALGRLELAGLATAGSGSWRRATSAGRSPTRRSER